MTDYVLQALDIVKAQATVRSMSSEEMLTMVDELARGIESISTGEDFEEQRPAMAPDKAIKEKTVTCLECGKQFKVLTRKHLAQHGMDTEEYREKWGYKKGTPLVCKSLQRERRKKMKEMRLWERRGD